MTPQISIIIPTYNGQNRIGACLDALSNQTATASYEILVIDDGSNDRTAELVAQRNGVRLIRQQNAGPGAARNNGVKEARGDIILFIDDDCIAEPDWLENMLKPFDHPEVAGAKGAYLTRQKSLTARFVQIEYEEKYDQLKKHPYIDLIDTYSAAFRRDVFLSSGGYDLSYPTASVEDRELSLRLAHAGHKLVFQPKALVWHTHIDNMGGYLRKKFKNGYWIVHTMKANPQMVRGTSDTPRSQKAQILLTGGFLPSFIFVPIFGWWGLLAPLSVLAVFALTMAPMVRRCFQRDFPVGFPAPLLLSLRAAGLTSGLFKGLLDRYRGRM